ncbi:hypothetical protein SLEP1_g19770 [Rubroshorea leprosula]|uniref:Uncharacterized protein n=1 Tax=Rubroshorea leprosula TaxID=152421 RepID=A0AAV5J9M9_9ROSI|nr:hypothetical protein SLEP1_g19770 [Rubroshorea leprosula]
MDPKFTEFSDYINDFKVEEEEEDTILTNSIQYPSLTITDGINFNVPSPDLSFLDVPFIVPNSESASFPPSVCVSSDEGMLSASMGWTPEEHSPSPSDDSDSSDPVLKYISQMLMEDGMEDKPCEFPLDLGDTEKLLYEVLGGPHPPLINQPQLSLNQHAESPESNISGTSIDYGGNSNSTTSPSTGIGTDNLWVGDVGDYSLPLLQAPLPSDSEFQSNPKPQDSQFSCHSTSSFGNIKDGLMESSAVQFMVKNIFSDEESILQFKRGFEEASKFLPSANQLIIDVESSTFAMNRKDKVSNVIVEQEKKVSQQSTDGSRGRKNHEREDRGSEEERSTKQSAVHVEENELSEMFDKVLLCTDECPFIEALHHEISNDLHKDGQGNESKTHSKRQNKKQETADLRTLLILCAQAVSAYDCRTAGELLKQIREHSSPSGNGSQRVAHYFANGLEARLNGSVTGVQNFFSTLTSKKTTAADILKAYRVQLTASPFKWLAIAFANKMICQTSKKATALHIIDFGILCGFQWPILIQHLATRDGGPPKLRITGIELPQRGFRPAERIEETGHRLAWYCERYNVPFEYNPIAVQNWETIQLEDLKIDRNEVLAVNNLYRFKNLLDETTVVDCPRDAVLKLIRKINPDIFVHSVVNGSFTAPFFMMRFREVLFHYSAIFDMLDTTTSHEEPGRLMLEEGFFGREAMNAVACEGIQRVERAEPYKQWQVRNIKAGFKPLPLNQELMHIFRVKLKSKYHKDFILDEDGHWMLQGWKGRILFASSCWVPA